MPLVIRPSAHHELLLPRQIIWSGMADSNCRPPAPKAGALPTEPIPDNLADMQAGAIACTAFATPRDYL